MNCKRCGQIMYRVVRKTTSLQGSIATDAKATCTQCSQFTDCAMCSACKDTKCLSCYNGTRKLPEVSGVGPAQDDE